MTLVAACRDTAGHHFLVFTFSDQVTTGSAIVASGTATIVGDPIFDGRTMTVNLGGVSDVQTLMVGLRGVKNASGQAVADTNISINILVGDTSGDKKVAGKDLNGTKSEVGQPVDDSNFRNDVDANGVIDRKDFKAVRSHKGHSLP